MTIEGYRRVLTTGNFKEMPKIVVLCGSTRFYEYFQRANYEETLKGNIVLSVGFYVNADKEWKDKAHGETIGVTPEQKEALDELHKRKIDLADEVLVLNVGGYIGESTRSEIEYAKSLRMPIRYLEYCNETVLAGFGAGERVSIDCQLEVDHEGPHKSGRELWF